MKIWIAYFATKEACGRAHIDARTEGINVLVSGVGGRNWDSESFFLAFGATEEDIVPQIQFFTENGASHVGEII